MTEGPVRAEIAANLAGVFADLEQALGVQFQDPLLLRQALIHRSYLNEHPDWPLESNERLEFLGDAVLGFVVAEYLYLTYRELSEGELTALRAAVVRRETLARVARSLNLGDYLYISYGLEKSGGRTQPSVLASALEAVLGAVFLDRGLGVVRQVILRLLVPEIESVLRAQALKDFKTQLQERAQAELGQTPVYRVVATEGPEHAKVFTVAVYIGDLVLGRGRGRSKQEAEQEAARHALADWARLAPALKRA
jgi:ribonuclease-3